MVAAHVAHWRRLRILSGLGAVAEVAGARHGHVADAAEAGFGSFLGCNARS